MRITLALGFILSVLFTFPTSEVQAQKEAAPAAAEKSDEDYYKLLELFVDTMDQVDRKYVKEVGRRKLMEAAIRGMLRELDQYSNYIPPEDLDQFRSGVENQFGGIGIQVSTQEGSLKVVSPILNSPAFRAGIGAGDIISEIEGDSTEGITIQEAVKKLKGKVGTEVNVTVYHPDSEESEPVKLKREIVQVETVKGNRRKGDGSWLFAHDEDKRIAYIRLTSFGRRSADDLRTALKAMQSENCEGLILDLRFNPGGLLSTAIQICDLFIESGKIVSTEGRANPKRVWNAHSKGSFSEFPMVVLVNRSSASASEIVSACLQDHDRAVVIGERSFGKGSVQNIIELEGGKSALKLTTAAYLRPSGKNINRSKDSKEEDDWGVRPNKGFLITTTFQDRQNILESRHQRDLVRRPEKIDEVPDWAEDKQLARAIEHLSSKLKPAQPVATNDKPEDSEGEPNEESKDDSGKESKDDSDKEDETEAK